MKLFLVFVCSLGILSPLVGAPVTRLDSSRAEKIWAARQNEIARRNSSPLNADLPVLRPYAEYEPARYLVFGAQASFESQAIKETIAKHLPDGMQLILLADSAVDAESARTEYGAFLPADRLKTLVSEGDLFWARDTSPEPVFVGTEENRRVGLVETRHRSGDQIARVLGELLGLPVLKSPFVFPGGNFITDRRGNCFVVEGYYAPIPEAQMRSLYGCQTVHFLPFAHGIGHVDETIKILSDSVALTDVPSYVPTLEAVGYRVSLLPRPSQTAFGTYANSLLVNGRVFLPIYGGEEDAKAIEIYRQEGLEVFPTDSNVLSDQGKGSIHCITMSYPNLDGRRLLHALGRLAD